MRIAMVVGFVVIAVARSAHGELCPIRVDGSEPAAGIAQRGEMNSHVHDFLGHWQWAWLDGPGEGRLEGPASTGVISGDSNVAGTAMSIPLAGDDIDRWWYVYLDRQRYRFLDVTQYDLLAGPGDWRWHHWAWPDLLMSPPPKRCVWGNAQPIPEPWSATLLALGAAIAMRRRRSVAVH